MPRTMLTPEQYLALLPTAEERIVPMVLCSKNSALMYRGDEGTNFGHVWESPESLVIKGSFRHQSGNAPFRAYYGDESYRTRKAYQGEMVTGEYGYLSGLPSVISAHRMGPAPSVIQVADGDVLVLLLHTEDLKDFRTVRMQIRDNLALSDPRLVRIP